MSNESGSGEVVARVRTAVDDIEAGVRHGLADAHLHAERGRYGQVALMCVELGALAKVVHIMRHALGTSGE